MRRFIPPSRDKIMTGKGFFLRSTRTLVQHFTAQRRWNCLEQNQILLLSIPETQTHNTPTHKHSPRDSHWASNVFWICLFWPAVGQLLVVVKEKSRYPAHRTLGTCFGFAISLPQQPPPGWPPVSVLRHRSSRTPPPPRGGLRTPKKVKIKVECVLLFSLAGWALCNLFLTEINYKI